jgi:hypothetical protein
VPKRHATPRNYRVRGGISTPRDFVTRKQNVKVQNNKSKSILWSIAHTCWQTRAVANMAEPSTALERRKPEYHRPTSNIPHPAVIQYKIVTSLTMRQIRQKE